MHAGRGTLNELRVRLWIGASVFALGFLAPLLVPLVARSGWPGPWKAALSTALWVGIPELFSVAAAAILGKAGFAEVKRILARLIRRHGPPQRVSRRRYQLGLVLFTAPLAVGFATPYLAGCAPSLTRHGLLLALAADVLLVSSLAVLGGEFWDKLRALFVHGARVEFPAEPLSLARRGRKER